jgi:Tfp pilus assembly protein PilN
LLNLKKDGGIGTVAFVYLGAEVNHIVIVSNGIFRFSREFILPLTEGENLSEILSAEINRTLFSFRQVGGEVEKVILYRENHDVKLLAELAERWMEIEVFDFDTLLDLTSLEEGKAMEFHDILSSLAIPIGAALEDSNRSSINFLSKKMAEGGRKFIKKLAVSLTAAGLFFALVLGHLGLSRKVDNYHQILLEKKISNQKMQSMVEEANRTQNERALYESRLALLSELTKRGSWWSSMFKEIASLTPDEMMLNSVEVNRKPQVAGNEAITRNEAISEANRAEDRWQATIKGEVVASDLASAMTIFNRFYSEFRSAPFFINVGVEPLKTSNAGGLGAQIQTSSEFTTKPSASLVEETGDIEKKKVEFEIKCQLRKQPIERMLYKGEAQKPPQ